MSPSNIISAIYQLKFLLIVERTAYTFAYYSGRRQYILHCVALLMYYCTVIGNSNYCSVNEIVANIEIIGYQNDQEQGQSLH